MSEPRILTHEELKLIFVGRAEREAKDAGLDAPTAKLQVGLAESAFKYLTEVAAKEKIDFVRRGNVE